MRAQERNFRRPAFCGGAVVSARTAQTWATRRERYGPTGHAGYRLRARRSPIEEAALRLIVRLHEEEMLSEGQCCQALDVDRIEFREIRDSFHAGNTVGERIRSARLAASLSQEALSARLGVTRPQLTNIEGGRSGVSVDRLIEIAAALGVPAASLLPTPANAPEEASPRQVVQPIRDEPQ